MHVINEPLFILLDSLVTKGCILWIGTNRYSRSKHLYIIPFTPTNALGPLVLRGITLWWKAKVLVLWLASNHKKNLSTTNRPDTHIVAEDSCILIYIKQLPDVPWSIPCTRAVPISLFADYTDTKWNQWFKQPIPFMRPIVTQIIRRWLKAYVLTKNCQFHLKKFLKAF